MERRSIVIVDLKLGFPNLCITIKGREILTLDLWDENYEIIYQTVVVVIKNSNVQN